MVDILGALKQASMNPPNELDQEDGTLLKAISHLEECAHAMGKLKGSKQGPEDFKTYIQPLLDYETESKQNAKSWRIVIDMPVEGEIYSKDPTIQICSGEPSYHRFVMKFGAQGVETSIKTECVVKDPDLSVLRSKGAGNDKTLAEVKNFYDRAQIQRIAILGSARVFAHPEIAPDALETKQVGPSATILWAQKYTGRAEKELNKLLDVMQREGTQFTTINGGWAGVKENSTGIPLISSLIGAIADAEQGYSLPPITIMPEVGAFDRVVTRVDAFNSQPDAASGATSQDIYTYFEIDGGWGDDSKFLVGFSTGLMVFEPYGFWTNIEIANGVIQDKPVAVIIDPANLEPGGKYHEQMKNGERFAEIKIPLPGDTEGSYRIYRDGGEAAKWIHDQSQENLYKLQAASASSSASTSAEFAADRMKKFKEQYEGMNPDEPKVSDSSVPISLKK